MKLFFIPIYFLLIIITFRVEASDNFDQNEHRTVAEVLIQNAKWSTPSDGNPPQILSYDVDLLLDSGLKLNTSLRREDLGDKIVLPLEFIQVGDEVQILHETGISPTKYSWFRIYHVPSMREFDAQGPSMNPMLYSTTDYPLVPIADVQFDKRVKPFQVSFNINGVYFSFPKTSDQYTNYYNGMPVIVNSVSFSDEDELGRYYYIVEIEDLVNGETRTIESLPMNDRSQIRVKSVDLHDFKRWGHDYATDEFYYNLKLTLEDDASYIDTTRTTVGQRTILSADAIKNNHKAKLMNEYQGKEFTIIEEINKGRLSSFKFQSTEGNVMNVVGPPRKPTGHLEKDEG